MMYLNRHFFSIKRFLYFGFTLTVLVIGYLSRQYTEGGHFIHDYVGDAIWAMMIYLGFRTLFAHSGIKKSLFSALFFTYFIEITQLYQADWLNAIRHTKLGGLILGYSFLWCDLVMYTIGIVLVWSLDKIAHRN